MKLNDYLEKGLCKQSEIALHTHDRIAYKRCRRKWHLSSPFGKHLEPKPDSVLHSVNPHLWFGSGIHFAMEDYHGYNRFNDPVEAFHAYIDAHAPEELPEETEHYVELGTQILEHYVGWEKRHSTWETVWRESTPLVEVQFSLVLKDLCYYKIKDLDGTEERYFRIEDTDKWSTKDGSVLDRVLLEEYGAEYVEIVYHGTLDRVVADEHGDLWILDYKTAKSYDDKKLPLDPQIAAYCWAAEQWLEQEIQGMIYIQIMKTPPKPAKVTKTGISADKRQITTHALYKEALIDYYGSVGAAPSKNIEFLNMLADMEAENGDRFIRYDKVEKNTATKENTYYAILEEGREMIDPKLPLYPNPTRDCSWDCQFRDICLAMEEDGDYEFMLEQFQPRTETRKEELRPWQKRLYRKNKALFPEEYDKYCKQGVDSLAEFMLKEDE